MNKQGGTPTKENVADLIYGIRIINVPIKVPGRWLIRLGLSVVAPISHLSSLYCLLSSYPIVHDLLRGVQAWKTEGEPFP